MALQQVEEFLLLTLLYLAVREQQGSESTRNKLYRYDENSSRGYVALPSQKVSQTDVDITIVSILKVDHIPILVRL